MRAVVQRVNCAKVSVEGKVIGKIGRGLVVFLGVTHGDLENDADYLYDKIVRLRVFEDEQGKMNLPLTDIGGELMVVSQFTLYADSRKGNRPSFTKAAKPELADKLYGYFVDKAEKDRLSVQTGAFGADMDVELVNDGPVTVLLDSTKLF